MAFVIGTVMALLVDAALQNALAAVQSPGVDSARMRSEILPQPL